MIDPTITISLFKLRTQRALVKFSYTASIYGTGGFENMGHNLAELVKHSREQKDEYYWSFARYKRNHLKADIQEMTAIMLEYPYSCRNELDAALAELPYVHYVIHSQDEINTKRPEERLLVAIPLVEAITDPSRYTRVASILSEKIGVGSHSKGDFSSTFLFAPFTQVCSQPKVVLHDNNRKFLNADQFYDENKGVWVNARLLQEGAAPQPKALKLDQSGLFLV